MLIIHLQKYLIHGLISGKIEKEEKLEKLEKSENSVIENEFI